MIIDHTIRQGNLTPEFIGTPLDRYHNRLPAVLLPTGITARFWMRPHNAPNAPMKVDAQAAIIIVSDAVNGDYIKIQYGWSPHDVDTPGVYDAGTALRYADGTELAFPNGETPIFVEVTAE